MSQLNKPKKILITNIVSLNTGDAAILWGMFEILRQRYGQDTHFVVYDRAAQIAGKYYPWATFRKALFGNRTKGWLGSKLESRGYGHWNLRLRYWLLRSAAMLCRNHLAWCARLYLSNEDFTSVMKYVQADLVISSGGTYLTENYGLWSAIYDYRLTLASGTPLLFFTQSLGPFRKPKYRAAFTQIFQKACKIFLRDEQSRDHVLDLGINSEKITLAKDAAFTIRPSKSADLLEKREDEPLLIAVSVRSLHFFKGDDDQLEKIYKDAVAAMINLAVNEFGAQVTFLSTCQGISEYWTDDSVEVDSIHEALPPEIKAKVKVDRKFRQPVDIVDAYQQFDLVIATRMHAAILGLAAGTPVLGIAYEFKLEELFHQLGMDDVRLSVSGMNVVDSEHCLHTMLKNLGYWRKHVCRVQKECRDQAWSVIKSLPEI